jgi:hypothetical protein
MHADRVMLVDPGSLMAALPMVAKRVRTVGNVNPALDKTIEFN